MQNKLFPDDPSSTRIHPVDACIIHEFVERWNEMGERLTTAVKIVRLNDDRRRKLLTRLRDKHWDWRRAIEMMPDVEFFQHNDRGWRPNIDFILRPNSVDKIIDGFYPTTTTTKKPEPKRLRRLGDG